MDLFQDDRAFFLCLDAMGTELCRGHAFPALVRTEYGHCPRGGKLRGVFHLQEEKGEAGSGKDRCSRAEKPAVHCPDPL